MIRLKFDKVTSYNKRIYFILPEDTENSNTNKLYINELSNCFDTIKKILNDNSTNLKILKMTIFLNCENNYDFKKKKEDISDFIRAKEDFSFLPIILVAQPPVNNKNIAIEILVINKQSEEIGIEYKYEGTLSYSKLTSGDNFEIYGAISGRVNTNENTDSNLSVYQKAKECFRIIKNILQVNNLKIDNIVRQWGYIGRITDYNFINSNENSSKIENYQLFNMARAECYNEYNWKYGYPSATGIGENVNDCSIEFIAINESPEILIIPLHNPKQSDAHKYEGKQFNSEIQIETQCEPDTPKFERGKIVISGKSFDLYVSGTAAILGEKSIGGDMVEQTKITIENILRLCSKKNLLEHGIDIKNELPEFSAVRVYIKNPEDYSLVEPLCHDLFGETPILFVLADVCRQELLIEIEAYLNCSIDVIKD
ncbi:MAG: hypothetical protein HZB41_08605 [Ignavibacteriae bacterium]|nr:hypothetical protein [Ignavibacteriota bacterium]